ncbi:MAG: 4Fe-4S binding protein [Chitinispirillaceae bacterium]|nr:4Fe-4S binding protein [Chitinispirillaceae bacterium]
MNYLKNVATLRLDPQKCTGCGRCTEVCPRAVLTINNRKAVIIQHDACIECGACMRNCAFQAISVTTGVGCATALITSLITGKEPVCGCSNEGSDAKGCC